MKNRSQAVGWNQKRVMRSRLAFSLDREHRADTNFLLQRNHHSMVGSEEDPENGPAVATSIFIAVAVYAVSCQSLFSNILPPLFLPPFPHTT